MVSAAWHSGSTLDAQASWICCLAPLVVTALLLCDTVRTIGCTAAGMVLPSVSSCCDRLAPVLAAAAPSMAAAALGEAATWLKLW